MCGLCGTAGGLIGLLDEVFPCLPGDADFTWFAVRVEDDTAWQARRSMLGVGHGRWWNGDCLCSFVMHQPIFHSGHHYLHPP